MRTPSFDLSKRYAGRVLIANALGEVSEGHNDVTYEGAQVLAQLLAGKSNYKISNFYFEFQNSGYSTPPVARTDTAASRQAAATGVADLIRAELVAAPLVDTSGSPYSNNRDTFFALTTATVGLMHGLAFSAGAGSKIVSACLIAAPGGTDYQQDLLYARYVLATPVAVAGSGQVSGQWTTLFT